MRMHKITTIGLFLTLFSASFVGCQTAQPKHAEQQFISKDKEVASSQQLTKNLDHAYGPWQEAAVQTILDKLIVKLIEATDAKSQKTLEGTKVHLLASSSP